MEEEIAISKEKPLSPSCPYPSSWLKQCVLTIRKSHNCASSRFWQSVKFCHLLSWKMLMRRTCSCLLLALSSTQQSAAYSLRFIPKE